jgi:hypothetical protein
VKAPTPQDLIGGVLTIGKIPHFDTLPKHLYIHFVNLHHAFLRILAAQSNFLTPVMAGYRMQQGLVHLCGQKSAQAKGARCVDLQ